MQRIEIVISADGTTKVETHGYRGKSCQKASLFLKQALGQAVSESHKSDWFQSNIELGEPQHEIG